MRFFLSMGAAMAVFAAAQAGAVMAAPTETVLYSFTGGNDGANPLAGLIMDSKGNLYGTTYYAGASGSCPDGYGCGTVFELTRPSAAGETWTETTLYSFTGGNDSGNPVYGSLIADQRGNLYGTTRFGGASGRGTVFELTPPPVVGGTWTETVLHSFAGLSDGSQPYAGLIADGNGNLYGTTIGGGQTNWGTVFELTPPAVPGGIWTEAVLHYFAGDNDAIEPQAGLIIDSKGNLYGTAFFAILGGKWTDGRVFELTPPSVAGGAWTEIALHNFHNYERSNPIAGVIADSKGNLYGTTNIGGKSGVYGTVFELMPPSGVTGAWTEKVLHRFGSGQSYPYSGLTMDRNGNLYGTASDIGTSGNGIVFELTPPSSASGAWSEDVLYRFTGGSDGSRPIAGLIADSNGNLYGTTDQGGAAGHGTVFELSGTGFVP
jgi:uncharacterized repeat protein (TIGR03803 family)